jgi:hypothetical protein
MTILALAAFAVSASTIAAAPPPGATPFEVAMFCTKSSQQTTGLTKICYYDCAGSEAAMTARIYEPCPHRTLRWRLNRAGRFGPSVNSR